MWMKVGGSDPAADHTHGLSHRGAVHFYLPSMSRRDIYYWKCDRPAAFHGTQVRGAADAQTEVLLLEALRHHFNGTAVALNPAHGQGNHLTWNATVNGEEMFVRVENGPEMDDHLAVESAIITQVRRIGVPTPRVLGCDATRTRVPFAWQALERINAPDLNQWRKQGCLDMPRIAFEIGAAVARWQQLTYPGYGPLDATMRGYHTRYADYFQLRLDDHLDFLVTRGFFTVEQGRHVAVEIENHRDLLELTTGCLVHKDLALWNILGSESEIAAFIDFDDAISGDPMDDLSLLGCFHDTPFLKRAFDGYQSLRPLPPDHRRRFWLHLLRNMLVKAVIRVGAGYFDRKDGFFLIDSGGNGTDLKRVTHERIALALRGLAANADPTLP
jgi:fructosamine-3-kinase